MSAALPLPEPFDLEAEIAAIVADRLPGMREREREDMCAEVQRGGFLQWLRTRELGLLCGLMFVGVLGVSWVAEQTMRSM